MSILDGLSRPMQSARISVIDQCNLRCTYCMPKEIFGLNYPFLPPNQLLSFDEIERLVSILAELGVKKVRLTGGEPFMRKGLPDLVSRIFRIKGIEDVSITTNGLLLGTYAERLVQAGLKRINVSLDSLDSKIYGQMNGLHVPVDKVLHSIEKASNLGLQIKINMVVQKGVNDNEILKMAKFCYDKKYTLRFIEYMDVGNTNKWELSQVFSSKEIISILNKHYELIPIADGKGDEVAKRYQYKGTNVEVGFISSVTEPFCKSCNRLRVSADGKVYTCLFASEGSDIRDLLQKGTDDELKRTLINIWENRYDRYSENRMKNNKQKNKIEMSFIGG